MENYVAKYGLKFYIIILILTFLIISLDGWQINDVTVMIGSAITWLLILGIVRILMIGTANPNSKRR